MTILYVQVDFNDILQRRSLMGIDKWASRMEAGVEFKKKNRAYHKTFK